MSSALLSMINYLLSPRNLLNFKTWNAAEKNYQSYAIFNFYALFLPGRNDMTCKFCCAALQVLPHPPLRLPQLLVLLHAAVLILPLLLPGFPQLQGLTGRHLHFQQRRPLPRPHRRLPGMLTNTTVLTKTYLKVTKWKRLRALHNNFTVKKIVVALLVWQLLLLEWQ